MRTGVGPGIQGNVHHGILPHVVSSARSEGQEAHTPARNAPRCEAAEPEALRLGAQEGLVFQQQARTRHRCQDVAPRLHGSHLLEEERGWH